MNLTQIKDRLNENSNPAQKDSEAVIHCKMKALKSQQRTLTKVRVKTSSSRAQLIKKSKKKTQMCGRLLPNRANGKCRNLVDKVLKSLNWLQEFKKMKEKDNTRSLGKYQKKRERKSLHFWNITTQMDKALILT